MGGYSGQSHILTLHPDQPLIARSVDFDIEIRDLTHKREPVLLNFPFVATSWTILDFQFCAQTLYVAVTVSKRGTQVVAFNIDSCKINSQVALQGCAEPESVKL